MVNKNILAIYETNLAKWKPLISSPRPSTNRSVQCPDSTLALKCSILKEATGLAMKEETTVRIPIPVPGEVEDFGVYAVPGLPRHVFVGPFTNRSGSSSIQLESDILNRIRYRAVHQVG